jgi:hypothetical protein
MVKRPIKFICGAAIGGGFLLANYAAQHSWPLWTITLVGALFLGAVVTYVLTMQS